MRRYEEHLRRLAGEFPGVAFWASRLKFSAADNASTLYPIAVVTQSSHQSIAQSFVAYVLSPAGQQVLAAAGFEQP